MNPCSVITGDIFSRHNLPSHPENQQRLIAALSGVPAEVPTYPPVCASPEDIMLIHDRSYVQGLEQICQGITHTCLLDQDTYVTPDSYTVALAAAGSAISAAERSREGDCCFALVRPPGHHAERNLAMGFCLFNNVAIAAAKALERVKRVAIIDWDLHHGNGTQHAFYRSSQVLYCSVHDGEVFPGTGGATEVGEAGGRGFTINAPLESGSSLGDYQRIFSDIFAPALHRFRPQVCIISAGQDMLIDDPLSSMRLVPRDLGILTRILLEEMDVSPAFVLEGGYGPSHGNAIHEIFLAIQGRGTSNKTDKGITALESTERLVELLLRLHHL